MQGRPGAGQDRRAARQNGALYGKIGLPGTEPPRRGPSRRPVAVRMAVASSSRSGGPVCAAASSGMYGHRTVSFVPVVLALAWAVPTGGCGRSVDRAARADVDARIAVIRPPSNTIPFSGSPEPLPFSSGQWALYKLTKGGGPPSFVVYRILGEEAGAFWWEVESVSYTGRSGMRVLMTVGRPTAPLPIQIREIRAVIVRGKDGRMVTQPPSVLPVIQRTFAPAFSALVTEWKGLPQEAVNVPAGKFEGCFRRRSVTDWGGVHGVSDTWSQPAVPIFGIVSSSGVDPIWWNKAHDISQMPSA